MSQVEITVRMLDEEGKPISSTKTLIKRFKAIEINDLQTKEGFNQLEQEIVAIGSDFLPKMLKWRTEELDAELARARKHTNENCHVTFDGKKN